MFDLFKSKEVKEVLNHFKSFKELQDQANITEDKDILTVLESDMASIALIMKINSKKNETVKEELLKIIEKDGFPSCSEFSDFNGFDISEKISVTKLSDIVYDDLHSIYRKYRKKILKAKKLISVKKYLRMESVINDFYSVKELLDECEKEFTEKEYNQFLTSINRIRGDFLDKANELSETSVYFKEELENKINFIFREKQNIEILSDEYKRKEINNLDLLLSKNYLLPYSI